MMTSTDRALKTFDLFLTDWIPPAMREQMFGHHRNPADAVRWAIRGIFDQETLPLRPEPLGYAVFRQDPVPRSRDYRNGCVYVPVSPVFENPVQGENSRDGFQQRRPGCHLLGEIREYLT